MRGLINLEARRSYHMEQECKFLLQSVGPMCPSDNPMDNSSILRAHKSDCRTRRKTRLTKRGPALPPWYKKYATPVPVRSRTFASRSPPEGWNCPDTKRKAQRSTRTRWFEVHPRRAKSATGPRSSRTRGMARTHSAENPGLPRRRPDWARKAGTDHRRSYSRNSPRKREPPRVKSTTATGVPRARFQ